MTYLPDYTNRCPLYPDKECPAQFCVNRRSNRFLNYQRIVAAINSRLFFLEIRRSSLDEDITQDSQVLKFQSQLTKYKSKDYFNNCSHNPNTAKSVLSGIIDFFRGGTTKSS